MKNRPIPLLVLALFGCSIYCLAQRPGENSPYFGPHTPNDSLARDNTSIISGIVKDMHDAPLKDVRVELTDGNGALVGSTYTNVAGRFEFDRVPSGPYTVVATSGLAQSSERLQTNAWNNSIAIHLAASDVPRDGIQGDSVSVAQLKIPGKARDEYRKAHAAMEKEKLDQASRHLEKALTIAPNYADALTLRAVLELNHQNSQGAKADLDKAIQADPNFAMAYLVMGSALNMESKFDDALRSLQRGESLAPNSWQAHFEMAKAYIGKEEYQQALTHLQRAESMAPADYPLIYLLEAHAHLAMKQYPQAMTALQAYLQKEPEGPNSAEARKMLEKAQAFVSENK